MILFRKSFSGILKVKPVRCHAVNFVVFGLLGGNIYLPSEHNSLYVIIRHYFWHNTKLLCKFFFSLSNVYIQQCMYFVHVNLLRSSSKLFTFTTQVSLATLYITSFTCRMTYSICSICSPNDFSGFGSIFLQMQRDNTSNMLFCYRQHY